ncbi:hypothetical protein IQ230_19320 [Gloeocapsopsis crepidinum LEGE 06123]|uniref:Uncharacterized protein n=1 Tax=Gloeocapsopsis crepidinum LEGE 06123 TaxID=588587 RepID=A0ABR9UW36_9CHRO|nr:hypothetical protein [Gloeocapsopsis crepidinum]MBE9192459.1 hypothetical protein [Gloeocapsopsis crepidinum LEGE 06123]
MTDFYVPDPQDRSLQKAMTNRLVDEYFDYSESWLRAILRMCIFSLTQLGGKTALLIECPNQAVAKRLSRKTFPLEQFMEYFSSSYPASRRVLICYQDSSPATWQCFDTESNTWKTWEKLQISTASTDG